MGWSRRELALEDGEGVDEETLEAGDQGVIAGELFLPRLEIKASASTSW